MPGNEAAIGQMAKVRADVSERVDSAVAAIIALCWDFRSPDFSFSDHLALLREANNILAEMSDGNLSDYETRAKLALAEAELQDYEDDAIDFAEEELGGEDVLFRLDRQADHLRDTLSIWLVVAALAGMTREATIRQALTHLSNPEASKEWMAFGKKNPRWGRGFPIDVLTGMTTIGQDFISRVFQFALVQSFKDKGAIGYRTVRQSNYYCPLCDEMTERIWPLDQIVLPYHPRCVCKAVPVYSQDV